MTEKKRRSIRKKAEQGMHINETPEESGGEIAMSEQPIAVMQYTGTLIVTYKNRIWSIGINTNNNKPYRPCVYCMNLTNKECCISRTINLPKKFDRDILSLGNKMMVNKYFLAWDRHHVVIMDIDDIIYGESPVVNSKAYATYAGFDTIGVLYSGERAVIEDVIQTRPNAIAIGMTCFGNPSDKTFARIVFADIENDEIIHTDKSIPDLHVKKLIMRGDKVMALCAKPDSKAGKCDNLEPYNQFELYVVDPATALVVSKKKLDDDNECEDMYCQG
jgi:hypothetical protein